MSREALLERFLAGCDESGPGNCWNWMRSLDGSGYGQFSSSGAGFRQAHKWAWTLMRGPVPDGMCVCHSCDNPRCVNPDHLFIATHAENLEDRRRKGRNSLLTRGRAPFRGSVRHAKITEEAAHAIYVDRRPYAVIEEHYGISRGAVNKIKCGERWAWVTGHDRGRCNPDGIVRRS